MAFTSETFLGRLLKGRRKFTTKVLIRGGDRDDPSPELRTFETLSKELSKGVKGNQMKPMSYFGLLMLVLSVFFFISAASAACDYSGTWATDWGNMVITHSGQYGEVIRGEYEHDSGKIDGHLSGTTVTGRWSEAPSYTGPNDAGGFVFTFKDCNSFTGTYGYDQSTTGGGSWSGTRISAPVTTAPAAAGCDMTGTWDFDGTTLVITQSGGTVHGEYVDQSGKLDGTLSGKTFSGTWSESPTYKGPSDAGKFVLTL